MRVDVPGEIGQTLHLQQSGLIQSAGVDVDGVAVGRRPVAQSLVELWSIKKRQETKGLVFPKKKKSS